MSCSGFFSQANFIIKRPLLLKVLLLLRIVTFSLLRFTSPEFSPRLGCVSCVTQLAAVELWTHVRTRPYLEFEYQKDMSIPISGTTVCPDSGSPVKWYKITTISTRPYSSGLETPSDPVVAFLAQTSTWHELGSYSVHVKRIKSGSYSSVLTAVGGYYISEHFPWCRRS